MRISDWSSDVCSSDLEAEDASPFVDTPNARAAHAERLEAAERALQEGRSANLPTASQRAVVRASDIGDAPPAAVAARQAALQRAQPDEQARATAEAPAPLVDDPAALEAVFRDMQARPDRKGDGSGKELSVMVSNGCSRIMKKKKHQKDTTQILKNI